MSMFLIHYDLLQKPDVEYPTLIPALTRLGARRLTASAWVVRTDMGVAELRDEIEPCAVQGDRFVIAQLSAWCTMGTLNSIDEA